MVAGRSMSRRGPSPPRAFVSRKQILEVISKVRDDLEQGVGIGKGRQGECPALVHQPCAT